MGYSGSKISGHSGTEFKNKKAFEARRAHNRSTLPKVIRNYTSKIERKVYDNQSLKGIRLIALISVISIVSWALYDFASHAGSVLYYDQPSASSLKIKENSNYEDRVSSYHIFVNLGNRYLNANMYKEAINRYDFAIKLNTGLTPVYTGYTKALFMYCIHEKQYCDQSLEYLEYASKKDLFASDDIARMKEQVENTIKK